MLPKGITFTHTDGSNYTTGKPGKPPKWLKDHPDYIKLLENTPITHVAQSSFQAPSTSNKLRCWRWNDQDGLPQTVCFVAAHNSTEAMKLLNKRFTFKVSHSEFALMWKEIDLVESISTPGVYEHNTEKLLVLRS